MGTQVSVSWYQGSRYVSVVRAEDLRFVIDLVIIFGYAALEKDREAGVR